MKGQREGVKKAAAAPATPSSAAAAAAAASQQPQPPQNDDNDPLGLGYYTTLRLAHLPEFARRNCVLQTAATVLFEIIEFLTQGRSSSSSSGSLAGGSKDAKDSSASRAPVWPEHLACAQARTAMCCIADCIRDKITTLMHKCELRRANQLRALLPLVATCAQEIIVDDLLERLNTTIHWTSAHSSASAASSAAVTPVAPRSGGSMMGTVASSGGFGGSGSSGVIMFPFENMDGFFCKMYTDVEYSAKEYDNLSTKIGANVELVGKTALKGAREALNGVVKLGNIGLSGVKQGFNVVAGGARQGFSAVAGAAEGAARGVGDVVNNIRREMAESDSDTDEEKLSPAERERRHQWDHPGAK
jgi:hypothetical protein